jgi:hypothetical protein
LLINVTVVPSALRLTWISVLWASARVPPITTWDACCGGDVDCKRGSSPLSPVRGRVEHVAAGVEQHVDGREGA